MTLYVLTVWLHILAAATWIGSMVFFAAVVVPLLRRPELRASAPSLIRLLGPRFRLLGWIALTTLIVTGAANLYLRGLTWAVLSSSGFWSQGFGRMLAWKLMFVVLVLALTVGHEVVVRESAFDARGNNVDPAKAERVRRAASLIGRFTLLASLAIAFFAVAMVRGCG